MRKSFIARIADVMAGQVHCLFRWRCLAPASRCGSDAVHATVRFHPEKIIAACRRGLVASMVLLVLSGCATQPIVYPPATRKVDDAQVQKDVALCKERADRFVDRQQRGREVGRQGARGALIGGASALAWGLVHGGDAITRGGAGLAAGGVGGAIKAMTEPDPLYARFMDRCLKERGHELIGWR